MAYLIEGEFPAEEEFAYVGGRPYSAESEGMCNDGCGYWVEAGDAVVDTEIGPVLAEHPEED